MPADYEEDLEKEDKERFKNELPMCLGSGECRTVFFLFVLHRPRMADVEAEKVGARGRKHCVYLSTTMGRSTNTAKPGQGR